jgi:hypothetical protein
MAFRTPGKALRGHHADRVFEVRGPTLMSKWLIRCRCSSATAATHCPYTSSSSGSGREPPSRHARSVPAYLHSIAQ